ncbi:alcohol dehydrogenase class IV [Fontibacillus phaseoli]|uniref:Alcohol dehydrogenase class IV n=1 Tax=Fontibacillus phaseoli TaxID=1416533 RepID=A0A369AVC9_9BACL|nr:iron-containing alcohol dehydrogenase [Fontibacillus phaseoli]RCX13035.1 alcohol dehydrogenase class IV [Fontibacillus phaseoli]
MKQYFFQTAGSIIAGCGSLERIVEHLQRLGSLESVLLVSQPFLQSSGTLDEVTNLLKSGGIAVHWNTDVQPEPTIAQLEELYNAIAEIPCDAIIGIGGGSVLDVVKLLSVMKTNNLSVREMLGTDLIPNPGIPTVLIPTTSGTGSEVTPNAIVTLPEEELKIGVVSRYLLPALVILDPLLTLGLPRDITASTGMDAYTHALESFISNKANRFSDMFALESIRNISASILQAYHHGEDRKAREDMLIGSMYGGMALTCAGTAAVHALAYPIGGKFHVPHGVANSMLLPHVMEFNFDAIVDRLALVAGAMGLQTGAGKQRDAEQVIEQIRLWTQEMSIPQDLALFGATREDIPELSLAASQVTRLMGNNPKVMTLDDIGAVYGKLFH